MRLVATFAGCEGMLNAIGGTIDFYLGLYKNDVHPNRSTTMEMLVECDYDGYARIPLTWEPAEGDPETSALGAWVPVEFTNVDGTTPNTIYGCFFTTSDGAAVWLAKRFDTPRLMDASHQSFECVPYATLKSKERGAI